MCNHTVVNAPCPEIFLYAMVVQNRTNPYDTVRTVPAGFILSCLPVIMLHIHYPSPRECPVCLFHWAELR
jgi:hypothetical protein